MTRPPFGFGPSGSSEEPSDDDPFGLSGLFGGALGSGSDVFGQLQRLMSWQGGPVNWDLAREVATGAIKEADRPVDAAQAREVRDACRLADVWLDPVTTLPGTGGEPRALSRLGWLDATMPSWRQLVDPVAGRVVAAMGQALQQGIAGQGLPEEMSGMLASLGPDPLKGVMDQVGGFVFGAQVGQALGALAGEVLGATEIGLPLGDVSSSALLPANIAAFSEGLEVPLDEVRLYLALREAAHQRLFAHVPWLRSHLFDAVDAYGRGIEVDPSAIERAVSSIDPSDPASLQDAMGSGVFDMAPTEAQQAALGRLETALALVEGWVDLAVDSAATGTLPHAVALRETVRRRRATGGPAEQTFTTLVGLQLRPRRLREAAMLWETVTARYGASGRDALWEHPDLLPGASDLDDPQGFVAGLAAMSGPPGSTGAGPAGSTHIGQVPTGDGPTGAHSAGAAATGDGPTGARSAGAAPTGDGPTGARSAGEAPTGDGPTGTHPAGAAPRGNGPTGRGSAGGVAPGKQASGPEAGVSADFGKSRAHGEGPAAADPQASGPEATAPHAAETTTGAEGPVAGGAGAAPGAGQGAGAGPGAADPGSGPADPGAGGPGSAMPGPAKAAPTDWDAGLRALDKDLDGELDDDAHQHPQGPGEPPDRAEPDQ